MSRALRKCDNCGTTAYEGIACPSCGYADPVQRSPYNELRESVVQMVSDDDGFDTDGMSAEQLKRGRALASWWMDKARQEVAALVPKAVRYGSADLKVMGEAMIELHPQLRGVVDGQELAVWFYACGKIARLVGGYAQGELPDIDSWWDMKVYAGMAQHIRETGGW